VPAPPAALPPVEAPAPSRVVMFQKPPAAEPVATKSPAAVESVQPKLKLPLRQPTADPKTTTAKPTNAFSRDKVFRLESDAELLERIVKELRAEKLDYVTLAGLPTLTPLAPPGTAYQSKTASYPPVKQLIEPNFLIHRRLYFEEKNSERYGWDLGIVQPVVSTLYFYKDTLLWPAKLASRPFERYDSSAGKCLPGSAVPYYLYPPEVSLFGAGVGGAVITGAAILIP
jgi:hypothetical protein